MKIFENKWFALIKDFNLQPLPNRFGVSMEVTRNYSELLNRDITSFYTNSEDRTLTQFNKQFLVNRIYDFRWDLSGKTPAQGRPAAAHSAAEVALRPVDGIRAHCKPCRSRCRFAIS